MKHDEPATIASLTRNKLSVSAKTITAYDYPGIGLWGKIDYLVGQHGYRFVLDLSGGRR